MMPSVVGNHFYRKNIATGAVDLVSSDATGVAGSITAAATAAIRASETGRYVAFGATGTGLIGGVTGAQVYKKDMQTNAITLVSSSAAGVQNDGATISSVAMTPDARYIAFVSNGTTLIGGVSGTQLYRKDTQTGAIVHVSVTSGGTPNSGSLGGVAMSDDGNYVAFMSTTAAFGSGNANQHYYVKNITTGALVLASSDSSGTVGNAGVTSNLGRAISGDGKYVVFSSTATNLVSGLPAVEQVYRKNIITGAIEVVSKNAAGVPSDTQTRAGSISSDGTLVSFAYNGNMYSPKIMMVPGITGRQVFLKKMP